MKQENSTTPAPRTLETWATELSRVLSGIGDSEPTVEKIPFDRNEIPGQMVWWRASGRPAISIGVGEQDAKLLQPSVSDILNRSWGPGETIPQSPMDRDGWEVWKVQFATGENMRFFVAPEAQEAAATPSGLALEMLMDVELPIVIRFGQKQMTLRDIAGLTAGSVIEFERGVDEPVEVMVNGHVVALGEPVTVKGAYGIRISETSSRKDRLVTSSFRAQERVI
jgi:flagellar motor switch protein FliN/FliY